MLDIEDFKKKLPKKSRLMGIDPGGRRIGIAISDENKIIATPYKTLIKKNITAKPQTTKRKFFRNNFIKRCYEKGVRILQH